MLLTCRKLLGSRQSPSEKRAESHKEGGLCRDPLSEMKAVNNIISPSRSIKSRGSENSPGVKCASSRLPSTNSPVRQPLPKPVRSSSTSSRFILAVAAGACRCGVAHGTCTRGFLSDAGVIDTCSPVTSSPAARECASRGGDPAAELSDMLAICGCGRQMHPEALPLYASSHGRCRAALNCIPFQRRGSSRLSRRMRRGDSPLGSQRAQAVGKDLISLLAQHVAPPADARAEPGVDGGSARTPTDPSQWVQPDATPPGGGERTPTDPADWITVCAATTRTSSQLWLCEAAVSQRIDTRTRTKLRVR